MKKQLSLMLAGLLVLAGCTSTDSGTKNVGDVKTVQFALPQQVKWTTIEQNNGAVKIYVPEGSTLKNTPVKVVYQFVKTDKTPAELADQVIAPLKQNCGQVTTNNFKTNSTYPNTTSYEILCNRLGKTSVGIITYVDLFTDSQGSHVLVAETKTPATTVPGQFAAPKTDAEKKTIQRVAGTVKAMQNVMANAKACVDTGKCM